MAATLRPVCIAVGETSNNLISTHCRELEDGGFEFVWFGEAVPVDGWAYCGYWEELCGVLRVGRLRGMAPMPGLR